MVMARKAITITIVLLVVLCAVLLTLVLIYLSSSRSPLKVGVLLPLSGPNAGNYKETLDWARENINRAGGVAGRRLELVYADTSGGNTRELAGRFLDDGSIKVVIGPATSDEVYAIAPEFIAKRKILLSPSATSGDLFKAFGGEGFFWRTARSDIAQLRTLLYALHSRGVQSVSVVSEDSDYGETFFRWAGFFSNELHLVCRNVLQFPRGTRDFSRVARRALQGNPETVVCACFPDDAAGLVKALRATGSEARIVLTDASMNGYALETLGIEGLGVEATAPSADPGSGFDQAYLAKFRRAPDGIAANTYDSLLLTAYVLARQQKTSSGFFDYLFGSGERIDRSFEVVVSDRGEKCNWNQSEKVIESILKGDSFDLVGSSGPLDFDSEFGVDPLENFYSLERIEQNARGTDFVPEKIWNSNESLGVGRLPVNASPARTKGSASLSDAGSADSAPSRQYPPRKNLWAVVIATSSSWSNYRHQADALSLYQLLKKNGVPDDRIVLFVVNDLAENPKNPDKGTVRARAGGPNLMTGAKIDYSGTDVRPAILLDVLLGNKSAATPVVLESDSASDVLLFMIGHGSTGATDFGEGGQLSAEQLVAAIDGMSGKGLYRRLFIVVDSCFGASMGAGISSPGALFLSAAEGNEGCFGADYDPAAGTWLSDEFGGIFISELAARPRASLAELYDAVYRRTAGSHPILLNYDSFGPLCSATAGEFVSP
jgi:ABC-type branched-subunit amino acid transport system substrate-binding protein